MQKMQKLSVYIGNSTTSLTDTSPAHTRSLTWAGVRQKYRNTRKIFTSKAALLTLLWTFIIYLLHSTLLNTFSLFYYHCNNLIFYLLAAAIYCLFPIAGHLADTKFGRYNTIMASLKCVLFALVIISIGLILMLLAEDYIDGIAKRIVHLVGLAVIIISALPLIVGIIGFGANKFQFGLDQLYDSPGEDQSLFIHWSTWTYYTAYLIVEFIANPYLNPDYMKVIKRVAVGIALAFFITLLVGSLILSHYKRHWFLAEPSRTNPYKLVFQVSKYAHYHKVPENRSAFTYCEDDIPSGLDLGKAKYGGPFTTEQVEDVKVFYGIFKVLLVIGLVFFVDIAKESFQYLYHSSIHQGIKCFPNKRLVLNDNISISLQDRIFVTNGVVYPLTAFLSLPIYLVLLRPFIRDYVPGMLKRMGVGIVFTILALLLMLIMETVIHSGDDLGCMFKDNTVILQAKEERLVNQLLVVRDILAAIARMLLYIPLYEFICSQSPQSMNGLLIGLSYAVRGSMEAFGALLVVPFALSWNGPSLPSCGMVFYIIHIVVAIAAGLVYAFVARKYSYRKRDDFCDVYRYAEDYYSR